MESFKPKIEAEDPQQEIIDDLETFVKGNEMSTEDLRIAYLISLDLPMSDIGYEINEKRENLAEKLRDCFDKGLTINRVPELISQREQKENIIPNYFTLVDELELTEREKKILYSIVEDKRPGKLIVLGDKGKKNLGGVMIPDNIVNDDVLKEELASDLTKFLSSFKGVKNLAIEFSF